MEEEKNFKENLKKYYDHLLYRFDKGTAYFEELKDANVDIYKTKQYFVYEKIIKEIAAVGELMVFYGMEV